MIFLFLKWVKLNMNSLWFLVGASLKKKIKSKWFIGINIVIFLLVFLTLHISDIITFFGGDYQEAKQIVVVDRAFVYPKFKELMEEEENFQITYQLSYSNLDLNETLKKAREDGSIVVVIEKDYSNFLSSVVYSTSNVATITKTAIQNSLNTIKKELAIASLGLSEEDLRVLSLDTLVNYQILDTTSNEVFEDKSNLLVSIVVIVFIMISFFIIINLVQMVGAEINDEKTNKTMEIIISDVHPKIHFLSKLISSIFFNLFQVSLFALYIFISSSLKSTSTSSSFVFDILSTVMSKEVIQSIVAVAPILIIFFIITLITYAMLSAILASATTNIDDFQQLQTPLMLIVSFGLYLSIFAMIFEGSVFVKVLSFFPLLSFMLSPTLYFLNQISVLSLVISMLISLIFAFLVYKYGILIYQMGILNYSGDHLWKKMWQALKDR